MDSPPTDHALGESFDSSNPFRGLVLCCTSIEADQRTEIAQRTADMGGVHKYDLTPDVTHLIVGDYNTAKYRHVAKGRPDIKPMAAGWVDAVRQLWVADHDIDFAALEEEWKLRTFESKGGIPNSPVPQERERTKLVCCLTGFEDNNVRSMIEAKVRYNGGDYVGDLSKRVTHLIVSRADGKKYAAARKWGICCVSIEWLHDSVERGMILDEDCYDPTLPEQDRGKGAWTRKYNRQASLGKRTRDGPATKAEEGRRKLRKSASMKLSSQRDNLWGDILVNHSSADLSRADQVERAPSVPSIHVAESVGPQPEVGEKVQPADMETRPSNRGIFAGCRFLVHGFSSAKEKVVFEHLGSHEAQISSTLEDLASDSYQEPLDQRYMLVPQQSRLDSHPQLPRGVHTVTEFFIERCIYGRRLFKPNEHVLGQPFPRFPIDGFQDLIISTTGFINEQLNQMEKTVSQLGAKYSERFNPQVSLLVCPSLEGVSKPKMELAAVCNIPVVGTDWLWQCITTGDRVPWEEYQFNNVTGQGTSFSKDLQNLKQKDKLQRSISEPMPRKQHPNRKIPPPNAGVDTTAFNDETTAINADSISRGRHMTEDLPFETAPTHQAGAMNDGFDAGPLSNANSNALNKSTPSPPKAAQSERKLKRFPTGGTVGDSEAGDDSDASTRHSKGPPPEEEVMGRERKVGREPVDRQEFSKRLNDIMFHGGASQDLNSLKARPQRRKRQIYGRAASNVSAASSASAESGNPLGSKPQRLEPTQSTSESLGMLDKNLEPSLGESDRPVDDPPPATQLGYSDPDATRHREAVMNKIQGVKISKPARKAEEKITFADLNANMNMNANGGMETRRSTRQKEGFR
ncbi:hypothetical protein F5Y15DRAFT_137256 [Xylariaceae sp. FL0016]|nr:hypothetical protein F5Y15DRAFT_137256 [Xylariaceae sp. FL0016]